MKKIIVILSMLILNACAGTSEPAFALNKHTTNNGKGIVASWYSSGRITANGQRFNPNGNTVAHRTLPFGTKLKLTNPMNGKSIVAIVTDRGPFIRGTGLDVSKGGASRLGFIRRGKTRLIMEVMR